MAIVNGKSGTFTISTKNPYISGYVKWQETYDNSNYSQTNKSKVTITAYLHRTNIYSGTTYFKNGEITRVAYFGKESVANTSTLSLSIAGSSKTGTATSGGGAFTQVYSASKEITHDSNGRKSITIGFKMSNEVGGVAEQSFTVPETYSTVTLTSIPRYATSNQSEKSKTETSITMNWSSDSTIDYLWYSTDGGTTWVEVGSVNAKSGTYTISKPSNIGTALAPNTTYNIITRVRRKDSQLTTNSAKLSVTTYNFPHCTSSPDFTIGDALTLNFYNPLSRNITVQGFSKKDGSQIFSGNTNGTSLVGFNDSNSVNNQYASIPNSQDAEYTVVVIYNDTPMTRDAGNIYEVRGTETPTINGFDYIDSNETTVAITGDNTKIVQNYSTLVARFNSATANNGAGGIASYNVECNGKSASGSTEGSYSLGTIDSSNNVDLTLTVVDSRGLSASKTIEVSMLSHSTPTANVTLERLNNYEDETYLTVDGSVSSVDGKNTMTIQYRYKVSGGTYNNFVTIGDRAKQTLSLDKNKAYSFNIVVTDAFGSTFTGEYLLNKGVFPLFIDTVLNSVGINCFPTEENSLEVNELNVFKVADAINKSRKQVLLGDNKGLIIEVKSFGGTDKIPIIVAGADNSSMTPVFTVIHMRSGSGFGHISLGLDSTITRDGNRLHINASQWSYFTVTAPLGCEISIYNGTL